MRFIGILIGLLLSTYVFSMDNYGSLTIINKSNMNIVIRYQARLYNMPIDSCFINRLVLANNQHRIQHFLPPCLTITVHEFQPVDLVVTCNNMPLIINSENNGMINIKQGEEIIAKLNSGMGSRDSMSFKKKLREKKRAESDSEICCLPCLR